MRFASKRKQGHVASSLDRLGHHPLMLGTCPRLASAPDLSLIGNKPAEDIRLLVAQSMSIVGAELTNPRAPAKPPM